MSFLGNWRSYDAVLDRPGLAGSFQAVAKQAYQDIKRLPPAQQQRLAAQVQAKIRQLDPAKRRVVDKLLERAGQFDPRALHGLHGVEAIGTIAQSVAALASVGIAFYGQREAQKSQEKELQRQHKLEQERLAYEREQADRQYQLQMMAAQGQGPAAAQPGGGMTSGTKKALLVGGAVAAGAVALAVAK